MVLHVRHYSVFGKRRKFQFLRSEINVDVYFHERNRFRVGQTQVRGWFAVFTYMCIINIK
jgi:hypothetical protein